MQDSQEVPKDNNTNNNNKKVPANGNNDNIVELVVEQQDFLAIIKVSKLVQTDESVMVQIISLIKFFIILSPIM